MNFVFWMNFQDCSLGVGGFSMAAFFGKNGRKCGKFFGSVRRHFLRQILLKLRRHHFFNPSQTQNPEAESAAKLSYIFQLTIIFRRFPFPIPSIKYQRHRQAIPAAKPSARGERKARVQDAICATKPAWRRKSPNGGAKKIPREASRGIFEFARKNSPPVSRPLR